MNNAIVNTFVEIELTNPEDFLKIKETLTRIGIASYKEKKLYQSVHILHKQGKFYIVSFKEMFILDGKVSNFTDEDKARRNRIVSLLRDWKLLKVKDESKIKTPIASMNSIKILPYKEKHLWILETKYSLGKKR